MSVIQEERTTTKGFPPIESFSKCGLSDRILSALDEMGYPKPTPLQALIVPAVMSGHNVIVSGSQDIGGPLMGVVLPMVVRILELSTHEVLVRALILVYKRELALDEYYFIQKFISKLGIKVAVIYGGVPIVAQMKEVSSGTDILISTPGRLLDCLLNSRLPFRLHHINLLVLSQADYIFEDFEEPVLELIRDHLPSQHQTVMLTDSFLPHLQDIAKQIMHDPLEITGITTPS